MQFVARFAGDGYRLWFCRVLKLPVTSLLADDVPTIVLQTPKHFPDFYGQLTRSYQYTPTVVASANRRKGRTPLIPSQGY